MFSGFQQGSCSRSVLGYLRKSCNYTSKFCSTSAPIQNNPKLIKDSSIIGNNPGIITKLGQPTSISHPHLLKKYELCIGICRDELISRRTRLMETIKKYSMNLDASLKNHLLVIPSANKKYMSDKIPYVFRQNSDFYYFSGCLEPESVLVLQITATKETKSVLFMRPRDKHSEMWDGIRTGPDLATDYFGVDESYSCKDFSKYLTENLSTNPGFTLWFDKTNFEQEDISKSVQDSLQLVKNKTVESPVAFFHRMRVFKSEAEIELMRKTCTIASSAINETITESKSGDSEHILFAKVDYLCRMKNGKQMAYPPVVAGGSNATTIHYIDNSQVVKDGDLVLMDAGCEYGGYCSDITRTWPINGQFSDPQRILYEIILQVQKELIEVLMQKGGHSLDELFDTMCSKLGIYLQEAGIIDKTINGFELSRMAFSFCPHHVSHYLGMDVHDTPTYSRSNPLTKGMVFTIEPGIYIDHKRRNVPEEFRGLGIRIEDDCAILSDNSVEILTRNCVKESLDVLDLARRNN